MVPRNSGRDENMHLGGKNAVLMSYVDIIDRIQQHSSVIINTRYLVTLLLLQQYEVVVGVPDYRCRYHMSWNRSKMCWRRCARQLAKHPHTEDKKKEKIESGPQVQDLRSVKYAALLRSAKCDIMISYTGTR